jgi:Leucine-rich repeat (LRR) protein
MTTLRSLQLEGNSVSDLTPLAGLKLTDLLLRNKQISDLSPLAGMPLIRLHIFGTSVSDLTPLKGMPLVEFRLNPRNITQGLEILRDIKGLKSIGIDGNQAWPPAEFWGRLDKGEFGTSRTSSVDDTWLKEWLQLVPTLTAEQQVAAVVAKLKERNPGLDGTAKHKIKDGVVTELTFTPVTGQDAMTDLSPVRALAGLTSLNLWGCSGLGDLEPLKGLPLTRLLVGSLDVSIQVRDLEPLRGMKLTELQLYRCQVQNLEPLQDMPLTRLTLFSRQVGDLGPLKGLPLTTLGLAYCTQIQDFTPLAGLPLTSLHLNDCRVRDLEPFKGMKLTELHLTGTPVRDLEPVKGMPLKKLSIFQKPGVTDLRPLQGMELEEIYLTPKNITQGLEILRDMQSLKTIGVAYKQAWPPAEFWERFDKGEFK